MPLLGVLGSSIGRLVWFKSSNTVPAVPGWEVSTEEIQIANLVMVMLELVNGRI